MTTTKKLLIGALSLLVMLIVWGLWLAAHPKSAPMQGQVDAQTVDVASKVTGRIATIAVREGDTVKAGDALLTIDIPELNAKRAQVEAKRAQAAAKDTMVTNGVRSEELQAAKAQYERAKAMADFAEKSFKRVDGLFKEGLISAQKHDETYAKYVNAQNAMKAAQSQYEMAQTGARAEDRAAVKALLAEADASLAQITSLTNDASLKAPIGGEISKIVLNPGELAPAGFPLLTITDLKDIWVVFNVREDEMKGFTMGTKLKGHVPALDRDVALTISYISPRADYATWKSSKQSTGYDVRTFEVRARPDSPVKDLRPGMSVLLDRP